MVIFVESEYIYKPTPPRSKSTATGRKPAPEQVSISDKLQQIRSSTASLSTLRPAAAAAADDDGGYRPGIRGTGTVYGRSDRANDDENENRDLPTIEELLFAKLQAQDFTTGGQGPDKTGGVEEVVTDERGGSVDQSRSAQSDHLSGSLDDPIVLLGDDDSSASEAEVDDVSPRAESATAPGAGLFESSETAVDSTTPAPPSSSDGWHDIDDFSETAPRLRLAEEGASTSNSTRPHTPSSHLSSEPLHDSISTGGSYPRRARSEATTPSSSPPPRHCRASPETQLSQEGRLHTGRGVADEHELVDYALDTLLIDEGAREQQEVEQEIDEDNGTQQEVNVVAVVVTAERAGGSPRPANGRQSLPNLDPPPEPSHNEAGCGSDSDVELNNTESDEDDEEPRPMKRKRPSSSQDGLMHKKPKHRLQQRSTGQQRPRSKPHGRSPKSHSPPDQASRAAVVPSPQARPSAPHATDTDVPPDYSNLDRSSRAVLPTLAEATFRPHSADCYSFTAVIYAEQGVSFGQLSRLIASIGHVGKIDDFTIKPMEQHSYLVTGFSRYTPSRLSSSGEAVSTAAEAGRDHVDATRPRPQHGKAMCAQPLASQGSELSSSDDDDSDLSDSDPDPSSDNDGCSSEAEKQGGLSVRMNIPWDPVDEQRLVAWKKEGKSWDWIFRKFPGRTHPAVRTRWSIVKRRSE